MNSSPEHATKQAKQSLAEELDLLTIAAISIIVYIIANVLHEAVGHAGTCLLSGKNVLELSTAHQRCDFEDLLSIERKFVAASGTIMNLIAALLFWLGLKRYTGARGDIQYFLWLSFAVNLMVGTGYFMFSGIIGVGDWAIIIEDWQWKGFWRIGMSLFGVTAYLWCVWISLCTLNRLIGGDGLRIRRAVRLTVAGYLIGCTISTLGAFLNPYFPVVLFTSAAAHFGGTSALAWMAQMFDTKWFPEVNNQPSHITRSWVWVGIGAVTALLHITILGPGLNF